MPTILAGQSLDIQRSPEKIVRDLIMYRWPQSQEGDVPAKDQISFSLFGWTGRKNYQISIEPSGAPMLTQLSFGEPLLVRYQDPILLHVWILRNTDEVPDAIHHITQKVEQIINENMTNVGYGITSIQLMAPFSAIESREFFSQTGGVRTSFQNQTEISLWHSMAVCELLYFKYITKLYGVSTTKTHKYDIQV